MGARDWIFMMEQMQHIHLFARRNIRRKRRKESLSAETLDILSRVALAEGTVTPALLSRQTGLTKPMISKLIEQLHEKGYLSKAKDEKDKRSYFLRITPDGHKELESTYQYYLEPVYEIRRNLGSERFLQLMELIREANEEGGAGCKKGDKHEIL